MYNDASVLEITGRLLIVFFFLVAGLNNLSPARVKDHIERMQDFGVPLPGAAFWTGIAMQFAGCALVLADWHADIGVMLLIGFTVVAGGMFHRFWTVEDSMRRNALRLGLLNNIAVVGGLLLLLQQVR